MNDRRLICSLMLLAGVYAVPSDAQETGDGPASLQGRWSLVSVNGKTIPGLPAYFEIDGRRISGFDGCNSFGGSLDRPAMIRRGERDCPGREPFPLGLDDPQQQLDRARVDADVMTLPMTGDGKAVFRRR